MHEFKSGIEEVFTYILKTRGNRIGYNKRSPIYTKHCPVVTKEQKALHDSNSSGIPNLIQNSSGQTSSQSMSKEFPWLPLIETQTIPIHHHHSLHQTRAPLGG